MYGARAFYRDWLDVFHAEMLRTLPIAVHRVIKIQCVVGVSPVGFYPESAVYESHDRSEDTGVIGFPIQIVDSCVRIPQLIIPSRLEFVISRLLCFRVAYALFGIFV
jgi:hypothetical protein